MSTKICWSHFTELLSIKDNNKIKYYMRITEEQNLGVRELREKIKNNKTKKRTYWTDRNIYELY